MEKKDEILDNIWILGKSWFVREMDRHYLKKNEMNRLRK